MNGRNSNQQHRFKSLDHIYHFDRMIHRHINLLIPHKELHSENLSSSHFTISNYGDSNHWNGYSTIISLEGEKKILLKVPSYKIEEILTHFPFKSFIQYENQKRN
ncbi:hypothetical protein MXB_3432 [Myxobolus squamalis]|nr:hypothetical protein MXB_3432 [Myxobolus squamalis]